MNNIMLNQNIILGTSFSPEYCNYLLPNKSLEILDIIVKKLFIKEIRFGLRWNRIEKNYSLSLKAYTPYLDYLFKQNCNICLNIGPVKTFRWPEEHILKQYEKNKNMVLKNHHELAKHSQEYLSSLLLLLKKEYGDKLNNVTLQPENECFNKFGHLGITMSSDYMISIFKIIKEHFPTNKIMIDSAGRSNLRKIVKLFAKLTELDIYQGNQLILGFNYYFKVPTIIPFIKRFEPINYSFPFDMSIKTLQKHQEKFGFGLEISEGQFETWGKYRSPGNSFEDFEYLIKKSSKYFPADFEKKLIRLWGCEKFAIKIFKNSLTKEHQKILQAITMIQQSSI